MEKTLTQYQDVIRDCQNLFENKMKDYGCAWRILRLPSLTDQIFIKAQRIRTLQEHQQQQIVQKVGESQVSEFIGIINYAIMAVIQEELGVVDQPDLTPEVALQHYTETVQVAQKLMQDKNHDYKEAWRSLRVSSLTDLILQKLLRVKQIEDNQGETLVSEGVKANYLDMLNYSVFALIHLQEAQENR